MSAIEKTKILAEIGKLIAEVWGIYQDKRKSAIEKEQKIKELEAEISRLKAKTQGEAK